MHIVVVSASSQTTRSAIEALLEAPNAPLVTGVYRDLNKVPADFQSHSNFNPVQGDISDASSLDFSGADAVLAMTPPKLDGADNVAFSRQVAANVRDAAHSSETVRRLVYVSSVGAHAYEGMGDVKTNHVSEQVYREAAPEVVFIRCAYFMENWAMELPNVLSDKSYFNSVLSPADFKIPMVSAKDIGRSCARELLAAGSLAEASPRVFELYGPESYSSLDVQAAFRKVTGKTVELRVIEPDHLEGFFSSFMPASAAQEFVEMTKEMLPGGMMEKHAQTVTEYQRGQETLVNAFGRLVGTTR